MRCGICKLCQQEGDLQNSHLMPAALYVGARTPGLTNPNPMLLTSTGARTTSKQLQDHVLCLGCEGRFNRNGESEVLRWVGPKRKHQGVFPLLDRLKLAIAVHTGPELTCFSAQKIGVDTEKFAYFALSVLWRTAVHRWELPDRSDFTSQVDLGSYGEPIRQYLLSTGPFPTNVIVVVWVCVDGISREAFYSPRQIKAAPFQQYECLVQGIYFQIAMGDALPNDVRRLCCFSSSEKWILMRDCQRKTSDMFAFLTRRDAD